MPFDGVVTKCVANELRELLVGSRVEKVYQPESDEIILYIRTRGSNYRLLLSANASYPRIHITEYQKENPMVAPAFCMLLRKHLVSGKITEVEFHDFERIITIHVESVNELDDLTVKKLVIEIMGRYSNIILLSSENRIMDSIKHVDFEVSRVREVMPGRQYSFPPSQDKVSPEHLDISRLMEDIANAGEKNVEGCLLDNIKGFSPVLCREICHRAGIDGKMAVSDLSGPLSAKLAGALEEVISDIRENNFNPCIIYDAKKGNSPADFHCLSMKLFNSVRCNPSISSIIDDFYYEKDRVERLKQKKSDILKVLNNSMDRCRKKLSIQKETLKDMEDREKLRLYGELITANIYNIPRNIKKISLLNYYSENGEYIEVPLDEHLLPQENAQRYFKRYAKAKSTYTFTSQQLEESQKELDYLESVLQLLENCNTLQEIDEIRQELAEQGYAAYGKKGGAKKKEKASPPLRFRSSDGFDIFVGKNNKQNDQLTLKTASSNDIWLHTQKIPGSHVIIKKSQQVIPESTLLEAAMLAAYHSKAKLSSGVPVDFTEVRNVKKPPGAKPGMVIYENFKTIIVTPDENEVKKLK